MNLVIISASQRKQSQSAKVAEYIIESAPNYQHMIHLELCQYRLPLWDGEQESTSMPSSDWLMINEHLKTADALILITPEWSGMASPLLKNFLLMCSSQETAHKPVLIVSVSSGISGAYPVAELRMNAFKNNKLVAIPDHLIIRNVEQVLNDSTPLADEISEHDDHIRHRIAYSLHTLHHYSAVLKSLRTALINNPFANEVQYAYGM